MPSSGVQKCARSEEHTSELQSHDNLVCRLLLEKKQIEDPLLVRVRVYDKPGKAEAARACGCACTASPATLRLPASRCCCPPSARFFFFNVAAAPDISTFSQPHSLPI